MIEHSLSHMEALLGVKGFYPPLKFNFHPSVAQMIELQTSFFRKQAEMMVDTDQDDAGSRQESAEDVSKPTKTIAEKAMSEIKAA